MLHKVEVDESLCFHIASAKNSSLGESLECPKSAHSTKLSHS